MHDIWLDNQSLLREINNLWVESEQRRKEFETVRNAAALKLNNLLDVMTSEAKKVHGDIKIKAEPVVEKGVMTGLKLWINDNCKLFKAVGNSSQTGVQILEKEHGDNKI